MPSSASFSAAKMVAGILLALLAWFAVLMQAYLTTGSFSNLVSYFTILCNTLVAVSLSFAVLLPGSAPGKFFSRITVQTAIALYIFIVGLVYNTVLRGLVTLAGWSYVVDNILHVAVPVLYLLYWFLFVRGRLRWKDGLYWLVFPLLYLAYSLVRGSLVHWYPYPFLNVAESGMQRVLLNSAGVMAAFLAVGAVLIAVNRYRHKKNGSDSLVKEAAAA